MGRFKELLKKYGKVALGIHCSVSTASVAGLYVSIKNNVDVESILEKVGMGGVSNKNKPQKETIGESSTGETTGDPNRTAAVEQKKRNRTAELAASSGGALALALICNKALFPIRVPITLVLTPTVARFLASRGIIKSSL